MKMLSKYEPLYDEIKALVLVTLFSSLTWDLDGVQADRTRRQTKCYNRCNEITWQWHS